jgi:translation initiation factor 2B subunit (eIF-2B alpha/beta/delta family)
MTMEGSPPPPDLAIQTAIAELAADRERGATELARDALDILGNAAATFPEEGLGAYLDGVGVLMIFSLPTATAVKGAVSRALADGPFLHPGQAKRSFDRARTWIDYAARATGEEAAAMIPPDATIVTCSYSSTVIDACAAAVEAGKAVRVIVLTSKVQDIAYGERMAEHLLLAGIAAEVYPDDVDLAMLGPITMGLVGADRVEPNGALVNGAPTSLLAGHLQGLAPRYVATESFKLDDALQMSSGFERVPADPIEAYVTDRGVIKSDQIWDLVRSA